MKKYKVVRSEMDLEQRANTIEAILATVVFFAVLAVIGIVIYYGGKAMWASLVIAEENRAIGECQKWDDWSRIYPKWNAEKEVGYYITEWQKKQCDEYGISINAPVIKYKN